MMRIIPNVTHVFLVPRDLLKSVKISRYRSDIWVKSFTARKGATRNRSMLFFSPDNLRPCASREKLQTKRHIAWDWGMGLHFHNAVFSRTEGILCLRTHCLCGTLPEYTATISCTETFKRHL